MATTLSSRFDGTCRRCGGSYRAGDLIMWQRGIGAWHPTCDGRELLPEEGPPTTALGDVGGLFALFDSARASLKFPKLRFAIADGAGGTAPIKLYVAGEKSQYSGQIQVVGGGRVDYMAGERAPWYGRINRDGTFTTSRRHAGLCRELGRLLVGLASDPARCAGELGRASGACCFCGKELADARSLDVGYGPVCASRFGLPWGEREAA